MDVCNTLPPRTMVDKLLSAYFNARYIEIRKHTAPVLKPLLTAIAIIHSGKFLREACSLNLVIMLRY